MQAYAYIPQTRQSMATAGKINLFGGGEMWSARLHSPLVPSIGQQSMAREASTCAPSLAHFHARHALWCQAQACNTALGMVPLICFIGGDKMKPYRLSEYLAFVMQHI